MSIPIPKKKELKKIYARGMVAYEEATATLSQCATEKTVDAKEEDARLSMLTLHKVFGFPVVRFRVKGNRQ